ncbi:hypothetical protein [Mechercharimyces sp. CAU 1602]|uniref:hypothetical protein n=1 Tax=Mechercharimyces sp. CAU 1602 TaxID=2973933 RepID=UPI002162AE29|nr:hypothetical protein [Mechercharimyces sp. CAU 1602]MCS1350028.1 hypothetical protein [Mechercharimyces sp. CAU 1602]
MSKKNRKKKYPLVAFISGSLILFVLMITFFFVYGAVGGIEGWPPLQLHLGSIVIFETVMQADGSFQMQFGLGIVLVALLGGALNALLSFFLNR